MWAINELKGVSWGEEPFFFLKEPITSVDYMLSEITAKNEKYNKIENAAVIMTPEGIWVSCGPFERYIFKVYIIVTW